MLGPTRANSETPFERFIGKTLDFSHLKVFGSLTYVHVDKEEKKLDAKAIKTTFIGYDSNTKGFKFYSLLLWKIIVFKNVFFYESQFGFSTKPNVSRLDIMFPPNLISFLETNNNDEVHDGKPIEPNNDESTFWT